jgi:predicted dehydrogenase
MKNIKWGMIGCGNVTELKSAPAFNKVPGSQLVAVMSRNTEKAKDYASRHGVERYYGNVDQLINDPEVNAVYVATPPDTHAHYAIEAMKAGKPVYVEKPMARSYAECLEMLKVSEQTGMPLYVAYYRRTLPAFNKVKELLEKGIIGKPLTVHLTLHLPKGVKDQFRDQQSWHVDPTIAGAGHFYDLASHQFDILDYLAGPVQIFKGFAANNAGFYKAEDTVTAAFGFEGGLAGSGSWCFVVDPSSFKDEIEITGTKGKITLPTFAKGNLVLTTNDGTMQMSFQNPENIQHNLIKQVVEAMQGKGECVSTGITAARTSKVMETIVSQYYTT